MNDGESKKNRKWIAELIIFKKSWRRLNHTSTYCKSFILHNQRWIEDIVVSFVDRRTKIITKFIVQDDGIVHVCIGNAVVWIGVQAVGM